MATLEENEELVDIKVPGYPGTGIIGVFTSPLSAGETSPYLGNHPPTSKKCVLILHGQGGHKDYCYLRLLAGRLARDLGLYNLRIDFRGCGDSGDNADPNMGRTIQQDVEDIGMTVDYLTKDLGLTVSAIIGHSKGGVAMYQWAYEQQLLLDAGDPNAIIVPSLINCAGRYSGEGLADFYKWGPGWEKQKGMVVTIYRHGKYSPTFCPMGEFESLSKMQFDKLHILSKEIQIMTIFGIQDHIVPLTEAPRFSNLFGGRHTLELIAGADHNYYGTVDITEENKAEFNPENLPLNSRNRVNYNHKVCDYVVNYLKNENEHKRFLKSTEIVSSVPRWKKVEGISNFRDIGGWKLRNGCYAKSNLAFRCANPGNITEKGKREFQNLGITAMFDFRSNDECRKDGIPEIEGVQRFHVPVFSQVNFSPEAIILRYSNLLASWWTYKNVYREMLTKGGDAFAAIFRFIRDHPDEKFVFHCTAGKDRTGVMTMLILLLVGVDVQIVAREYELTTTGLKADIPTIKERFAVNIEKVKLKFGGGEDFVKNIVQGRENWTLEKDGFENLISSRYEAMMATIDMLNEEFGGVRSYMMEYLGFNEADLVKIYNNLVVSSSNEDLIWEHRSEQGYKI